MRSHGCLGTLIYCGNAPRCWHRAEMSADTWPGDLFGCYPGNSASSRDAAFSCHRRDGANDRAGRATGEREMVTQHQKQVGELVESELETVVGGGYVHLHPTGFGVRTDSMLAQKQRMESNFRGVIERPVYY
jgi:hypothetical protein